MKPEELAKKIKKALDTLNRRSEIGKVWCSFSEDRKKKAAREIAERALEEFTKRPRLRNVLISAWGTTRGHLGSGCKCLRIGRDGEVDFYHAQGDWGCVLGLEYF